KTKRVESLYLIRCKSTFSRTLLSHPAAQFYLVLFVLSLNATMPFAIVLGLVYNFLLFMILPIYTSVEKLDNALIEAAYDLGAGPIRAFSQVIIPLTRPGIAAGAMLLFVPSIAMFAITTLMGGGTNPTIGVTSASHARHKARITHASRLWRDKSRDAEWAEI
ncbi:MAG: ABC transporter permease subunit, partial [Verrucomicrobia bacterium]|nr:ABC transporter permease subunit [Verrucomicrobiota bacterium]